jgi:hypothetical protein
MTVFSVRVFAVTFLIILITTGVASPRAPASGSSTSKGFVADAAIGADHRPPLTFS